jgi:hypothetical protein
MQSRQAHYYILVYKYISTDILIDYHTRFLAEEAPYAEPVCVRAPRVRVASKPLH